MKYSILGHYKKKINMTTYVILYIYIIRIRPKVQPINWDFHLYHELNNVSIKIFLKLSLIVQTLVTH